MYSKQLQTAAPGILLVEEAGEILESHILTAMTPSTKQLILIGDHKQLRPKVTNYNLTVEKGDGYDLNRSMFERLALSGFPHTVLQRQHRMCPEISSFVRALTYPDLLDADSTTSREPLRGIRNRVIFIKHEKQELASMMADRRDQGATVSKQNEFEAHLTLSVVKYLAQQGYGASDQVVLTPYLGQLNLLRGELAKDNDPVLNDLDAFDLVKAGVMSTANAAQNKRQIHLSTIDNYQGEESDIVIVNLTRSNPDGDIGFMASPERLNVMLSRARKALIIIGNPVTFTSSRKGGELWNSFFGLLAESNSIFDGLPVRCERHQDREMVLSQPSDFELYCPDGGCSAPCGAQLACGVHTCPQKCHRRTDHSKMKCPELVRDKCPKGHILTRKCSDGHPASCHICDAEIRVKAERQARDLKLEQARQEKQRMYSQQLAELQDEIDHHRGLAREKREREDQEHQINQHRKDLEAAKVQAAKREAASRAAATSRRDSAQAATTSQNDNLQAKAGVTQQTGDMEGEHSPLPESDARDDWEAQKASEGCQNEALDKLMEMIGLEGVKEQFLEIKSKIDLAIRQDLDIGTERFGAALLGNPGTGKTTVARLYAKFLTSVGALPGDHFAETTGAKLANDGVKGCEKLLETIKNAGGGALFIDEAYQLTSGAHFGGPAVLDFLLAEVENLTGKVVFILAGYNKHMEKLFAHNPGLPSRFPREFQFADYQDHELLEILQFNISKRYEGRMKVEDGLRGLYARILVKRLGRGRGKEGFGNARAVENAVAKVASRQAKRVRKQRKARKSPDDMLFTKEDLIGPEPTDVLSKDPSWIKLQKMIGLSSVKESVKALLDSLQFNYQRELNEEPIVDFSLNKVFLGSPGTGKTTVAKLYGQILADIGMLSSGEVVVKKPADFVGGVLGASEANTKGILDAAIGKVLVLDEAYGLYGGAQNTGSDPYRTAVVDTIVAEVQNVPGDDRCVLLLGYKEQMEEMMQNSNPGLARRFPIDSGFHFQDFTDDEMALILDMKLKEQHFSVTDAARTAALEVLRRARNRPHFGNAGEVDILLNDAKMRQQKRISKDTSAPRAIFEARDFDPDFDRGERAVTNIGILFRDTVGCESVVAQLQSYQTTVANMKKMDMDPREQIPFAFLFRGPPGTGKTTTAKRMGKVYYDMGFLASAEVVSCSASDLIGEYVGQTGPKTRKLLESALGKVLFIDEAYRLGAGHFAQEAMDELVDCMTKDQFFRRLIIILAGYDADINRLMSMNPGLTSRFPEAMVFTPLKPNECFDLLQKELRKKKCLDTSILDEPQASFRTHIMEKFELLAKLDNFANARDVQTLAKDIFGSLVKNSMASKGQQLYVGEKHVMEAMERMIDERLKRSLDAVNAVSRDQEMTNCADPPARHRKQQNQSTSISQGTATATEAKIEQTSSQQEDTEDASESQGGDSGGSDKPTMEAQRDAGVSDAIWNQLQLDKAREEEAEREFQRLQDEERKLKEWLKACADAKRRKELEELERERKALEEEQRRLEEQGKELEEVERKRKALEEQRRREAKVERERKALEEQRGLEAKRKEFEELERKREALEEQRAREAEVKERLMRMGRCPVGYGWIKQQEGYRCAGGSHYLPDAQVNAMLQ
ncbi:nfx1-type zinc finger-containing 1 [Lecanosticta acicola]|uniref:Nfx1-type zinc finger-containing 1 n=1 Tax=Lecanosticta acicola TaxID=111012 RepID=A0AAI8Z5B5_9PEZI|nr:nfx1-type zinc finger-containing 1 [Lecanosticta acicola]